LQEVLEPEVQRPAAALRRDDVEHVPEREIGDAKRQLLVDVSGDHQTVWSETATSSTGGRERRARKAGVSSR